MHVKMDTFFSLLFTNIVQKCIWCVYFRKVLQSTVSRYNTDYFILITNLNPIGVEGKIKLFYLSFNSYWVQVLLIWKEMQLPFIEKRICEVGVSSQQLSNKTVDYLYCGRGDVGEILPQSGWRRELEAGNEDGSVSPLAQLSSRRERERRDHLHRLLRKPRKRENAKIWQHLNDKVMTAY